MDEYKDVVAYYAPDGEMYKFTGPDSVTEDCDLITIDELLKTIQDITTTYNKRRELFYQLLEANRQHTGAMSSGVCFGLERAIEIYEGRCD